MVGFTGIKDVVDSELFGRVRNFQWRKVPVNNLTATGNWFDLAYAPGNPTPNYYIGSIATATQLKQSTDGGLYHGSNVAPAVKVLRKSLTLCSTATTLPIHMMLCDYLMFYPFIDEGTTDEQFMTNNVTLPRYANGVGVKVMAVSVAGRTGGQSFFFTYTNSDGVSGRISQTVIESTTSVNGVLINTLTTNAGPFLALQSGDTGVRSIESVTMLGADVGLFTLVLVKPLSESSILEITSPVEVDYLIHKSEMPVIIDDAFLGMLLITSNPGLASTVLMGNLKVVWN